MTGGLPPTENWPAWHNVHVEAFLLSVPAPAPQTEQEAPQLLANGGNGHPNVLSLRSHLFDAAGTILPHCKGMRPLNAFFRRSNVSSCDMFSASEYSGAHSMLSPAGW